MDFDALLQAAQDQHHVRPEAVAEALARALPLLQSHEQVPALVRFVTHLYAEHLERWEEGVALLQSLPPLAASPGVADAARAVARGVAVLKYMGGSGESIDALGLEDRVIALATACAALAARGTFRRAIGAYAQAIELAQPGLPERSPAARALAVGGNNLAEVLEDKPTRDAFELRGMLAGAENGLKYWRLAGGWLEEERAEHRLARSLLKVGMPLGAALHAQRCIDLCQANQAPAIECLLGHAALALAQRAGGDAAAFAASRACALHCYAQLAAGERAACEAVLIELADPTV
jgi:hypothetical protein